MTARARSRAARQSRLPYESKVLERIMDAIKLEAMTCDEVEVRLGYIHQTASSSITKLRKAGRLQDSGQVRPTRTGSNATVWAAKW